MKFLSINEAVKKYKTSRTTITRFARTHQKTENVKKENGKYLILDNFLDNHFLKVDSQKVKTDNLTIQNEKAEKEQSKKNNKDVDVVQFLQEQITTKDDQLSKMDKQLVEKDRQIDKLLQRQSEQNIIIQTMQNRFAELQNGIDNGVKMLSENTKENKQSHKDTDNGFTIASAIMIILLVVMIVVYLTVK